jgi:hypothetical protein
MMKSPGFVPPRVTLEILSVAVGLTLVSVTVKLGLVRPTCSEPIPNPVGVNFTSVPTPVRVIRVGLLPSESVTVSVPGLVPVALGVKSM